MKKARIAINIGILLCYGAFSAQEIIRTEFLKIGDAPFQQNISKVTNGGKGFSMYTVSTTNLDAAVKAEIKAQAKQGFKAVDKANVLFGFMRTLDSPYALQAGTTYRIVTIFEYPKDIVALRAVKEDGQLAVPELKTPGEFRGGITRAQLQDYTPTKNETVRIQNLTMSTDANMYWAVRYLIFKKKSA